MGPAGANGKIELVTCRKVTKTIRVHGHKQRVSLVSCTAKLVPGPVKFTTNPRAVATLSRSGVVFAIGRGMVREVVRPARPGRYLLTQRRGRVIIRHEITLR